MAQQEQDWWREVEIEGSADSETEVIGVFQKRGRLNTEYKRRFFVLRRRALSYFGSQADYDKHRPARGVLSCNQHMQIEIERDELGGRGFHFKVTEGSGRELHCMTDSEEQRDAWVTRIQGATRRYAGYEVHAAERAPDETATAGPHPSPLQHQCSLRETIDRELQKEPKENDPYIWQQWRKAIMEDRDLMMMRDPRVSTRMRLLLRRLTDVETEHENEQQGAAIHPKSAIAITIALISGLCLFYTLLLVPFALAFFWNVPLCEGSPTKGADLAVDTFFMFEILLTFFTGRYVRGELVSTLSGVASDYARSGQLMFDVCTSVPVSWIEYVTRLDNCVLNAATGKMELAVALTDQNDASQSVLLGTLCVRMCVCVRACVCVCACARQLVSQSILSVCLSVCPFVRLSVCQPACLFVCLSACLSTCLPVCLSICLSVCVSPSLLLLPPPSPPPHT